MSEEVISLCSVNLSRAEEAHRWHSEFAKTILGLAARDLSEFQILARENALFAAECRDEIVGVIFFRRNESELELSGLTIGPEYYGGGLGETLAKVAFAFLTGSHQSFFPKLKVTAKINKKNPFAPIGLLQEFGFEKVSTQSIVVGSELHEIDNYELVRIKELKKLVAWLLDWDGTLTGGQKALLDFNVDIGCSELAEFVSDFISLHSET